MKAQEYRVLSDAELAKKLADLKAEFFNLRFSNSTGSLANPMAIVACKKEIAKANTVIRERQLGLSKAPEVSAKPASKKAEAKKTEGAQKEEAAPAAKITKTAVKKETATKAAPKKEKAEKIMV